MPTGRPMIMVLHIMLVNFQWKLVEESSHAIISCGKLILPRMEVIQYWSNIANGKLL